MAAQQPLTFLFLLCLSLLDLLIDVWSRWKGQILAYLRGRDEKQELQEELRNADSFEEWQEIALKLDLVCGNDLWRQTPTSPHYDYKLIASRFRQLMSLQSSGSWARLADVIQSGSIRNMGSLVSLDLYSHAFAGTKFLIEDYIEEYIRSLDCLADSHELATGESDRFQRRAFFHDTLQSYGRTTLSLHGGTLFGMCHIGVVKALLDANLLPQVICGATVGAIVAAYTCSVPETELAESLESISSNLPAFHTDLTVGVAESVLLSLYPPEIILFEKFVANHLGDMTFEEAYVISGRIVNILVLPEKGEVELYNYLSTPKVILRTAVRASIGTGVIPREKNGSDFKDEHLLVKDYLGMVVPHPDDVEGVKKYIPANRAMYQTASPRESPYSRLSELLNVNNFVVSVSRPYFAPFMLSDVKHRGQPLIYQRILGLLHLSLRYRISQLSEWGLMPQFLKTVFVEEAIPGAFQVNVVPEPTKLIHDCLLLLDSTNIKQKVDHWIKMGERGVWPKMSIIWARTAIEHELIRLYEGIDQESVESPPKKQTNGSRQLSQQGPNPPSPTALDHHWQMKVAAHH